MADRVITLNHGAGGEIMRRFVKDVFAREFDNPMLSQLADSALINVSGIRLAFSTDSYVVKPVEFPGGNIGKLSVCGTVNDLAVMGARPLYLSAGYILEEGLDEALLERIVRSAAETAQNAGVQFVTGDTKVVPRGECDRIFINTAGIGVCPLGNGLSNKAIEPGDAIIVSGTMGDHGIAILGARDGLSFQSTIQSDCAPLNGMLELLLKTSDEVKWMRDPTRGGLAAVLTELVESQTFGAQIEERAIPVNEQVLAICELLGFDPMHLANEGKVVIVAASGSEDMILDLLHSHPLGRDAALIGHVTADSPGRILVKTPVGGLRRLQRPSGELLPRIC